MDMHYYFCYFRTTGAYPSTANLATIMHSCQLAVRFIFMSIYTRKLQAIHINANFNAKTAENGSLNTKIYTIYSTQKRKIAS